jgi:hypothetical protein
MIRVSKNSLLILMLLLPLSSRASVIEFTDRAAWQAAAGAVTNIDFEGIAPPGGLVTFTGPVAFSGVQFASPVCCGISGTIQEEVVSAGNDYVGAWGSGDKLQGFLEFDITLPADVFAVGTDIMNSATFFLAADGTYTAALSTGDVFSNIFASRPPTRSFVGFVSTTPITSLTLTTTTTFAMLDNFAFTTTASVPEPSSLALVGAGILVVFVLARKRRSSLITVIDHR